MNTNDSTKRFSDRVENYSKYRPKYPKEIIQKLQDKKILTKQKIIADIGSGTGIFSQLLLDAGCKVIGIEPNKEMRVASQKILKNYKHFTSVNGQAENTTLQKNSIDVITSAQAFHWFDLKETRKEFLRILKPAGYLIIIWNERLINEIPFQKDYDSLLKSYCPDYNTPSSQKVTLEQIQEFFGNKNLELFICSNFQVLNFESFKGRLESSSYCLTKADSKYRILMKELRKLFDKYQKKGQVTLEYKTKMYFGQMIKGKNNSFD